MNRLLFVCLIAATFTITLALPARAQAPALRKGVSVQMAVTHNASPVPEADNEDAWVVTVAADGQLYFGADPMTQDELAEWMKTHPRNREARLYIKADARAPFASVEKVLAIGRAAYFEEPVLLTSQAEPTPLGTMVPPKGLEVRVGAPPSTDWIIVQVSSGQPSSALKIDNQEIPAAALPTTLRQLLQNRTKKVILVKAAATIPFAQVVHAIDACHSAGGQVALSEL